MPLSGSVLPLQLGVFSKNEQDTVEKAAKALGYPLEMAFTLLQPRQASTHLPEPFPGACPCTGMFFQGRWCLVPQFGQQMLCIELGRHRCMSSLSRKKRCRCDGIASGTAVYSCSRLHLTSHSKAMLAGPVTVADALAWHVDLLSPVSKPALQGLLALAHGKDREGLEHILNGSAEQYRAWHKESRCLLEVLEEFPNIQPPLGT